jgi:hypothetical protein
MSLKSTRCQRGSTHGVKNKYKILMWKTFLKMGLERQRVYVKETLESIFAEKLYGYEVVRFNKGVSRLQVFKDHDDLDIPIIQKWGE